MTRYAAFLRAVNVGGTGKLPMADLKAMCEAAGFADVRTYIASGNVVFTARDTATRARQKLEQRLEAYAGKPVGVIVRTATELSALLDANPFKQHSGNRVVAILLAEAPPADALKKATGMAREELSLGAREIYVHYPDGIGTSKLKINAARTGTARNMNTLAKIAAMLAED